MELLIRKDAKITSINSKNDIFSLGMALLHLTTRTGKPKSLYDQLQLYAIILLKV
jgi:hypothetical protein